MTSGHPPVVLVEPDQGDELLLRRALRSGGLVNPVVGRRDAEAALVLLTDASQPVPAVLVTTLDLPCAPVDAAPEPGAGCGGLDLLRAVRRTPRLAGLPVVVLGGARVPDGAALERVHSLGAAYLAKPVAFGGLVQVIRGLSLPWALTVPTQRSAPHRRPTARARAATAPRPA